MKLAYTVLLGASAAMAAPAARRSVNTIVDGDNTTTYTGSTEGDIVVATGDNVTVGANLGDDIVVVQGDDSTVYANGGDDLIIADGNNSTVFGGDGNDAIINAGDSTTTWAGEGNDAVLTTGDNTTINAGAGNDTVVATGENTTVDAGAGNDTVYTGAGSDVIDGGDGNDKIHAGAGDDSIVDSAGNDKYHGNKGDDTFVDGAGNDTYRGGKGNDVFKFDLTANSGRMNRVFHFQHNEAKFQDELHLLNVDPSEIEFDYKITQKCRTDMRYTDPVTGKKRTVRVHSRFGCLGANDIEWDAGVTIPNSLAAYTKIANVACGASGEYAYINYGNPLAREELHFPGGVVSEDSANPLRWLQADSYEAATEQCAEVCTLSPECVGFNVLRNGQHSNGFNNIVGPDNTGAATCYFRSNINTTSGNGARDCFRIIPEITLLSQESSTDCVEDVTYGFTNDFSQFYVDEGCRGLFQFGDDPTPVRAESWEYQYAAVNYDTSNTNRF
jgi:hypothetical protein